MSRTIQVTGMTCGGCERTVESALPDVRGVSDARADRVAGTVTVEGDAGTVTVEGDAPVEELVGAVEDAGYEASA